MMQPKEKTFFLLAALFYSLAPPFYMSFVSVYQTFGA